MFSALFLLACSNIALNPLPTPSNASNLMLILHGSGDSASDWPQSLKTAVDTLDIYQADWDIWTHDWEELAASKLSASGSGLEVGELIAVELLEDPYAYSHLHLVGHSVGAFVTFAIARTLSEAEIDTTIHTTFLDPFTGNGLFDWAYGEREFGRHANFAESFYNTDDSVPSTNGTLKFAHNFDITALKNPNYPEDKTHWWPVDYYIESVNEPDLPGFGHSSDRQEGLDELRSRYEPGGLTVLTE